MTVIETTTATGSPIIWSGAATKTLMDRPEWFWGTNWQGNAAPADTTTAEVRFEDAGLGTSELTMDRTVGTLTSANTAGEHIIVLGGKRLAIPPGGTLRTGNSVGTSSMTIINGTLVLGTDEGSADLRLGINGAATGHVSNLKIEGTIEAHIGKLHVANAWENGATLDLTQAQIQGGVLAVDELIISSHPDSARNGFLLLGESTLTGIVVADVLTIGKAGTGRIGDPGNYDLPAGVSMQIGSEGSPATLAIGTESWGRVGAPANGRLVATSGGSFEAWLTTMDVATRGGNPWGGHTNGIVDLRPMGGDVTIDADATQIGVRNTANATNSDCIGSVYLGGGTLTTGSLAIGQNSSGAYGRRVEGLLQLENGAKATVSDSFIIGTGVSDAASYGRVVSLVGGSSTGLHIEAGATVEIGDRARIEITFSQTPAGSGLFWGLRWGGDHVQDINDLVADGRLVIVDDELGKKAEIFLAGGDTYIGIKAPTIGVSSFSVADQSTGSMLVTDDPTVAVTMTVEGEGITGYMITESAVAPAADGLGWLAQIPATYVITGGLGQKALYAWATDGTNVSEGKAATILFSTATPVVSKVAVNDNGNDTARATWNTDIPAQGGMTYGEVKMSGVTPNSAFENAVGLSHSVTFATAAGVNYKIILVNNEIAGDAIYWPIMWPILGDATLDCQVNILDLIYIRNKLNQNPATGDNWRANVNIDPATRLPADNQINILDLIYTRNKLNTRCP